MVGNMFYSKSEVLRMIYTVTFNPAVDLVVYSDKIEVGAVNRLKGERIYFGGKGINVSLILHELGVPSKALGFAAGFTGEAIEKGIADCGVETDFVHLDSGFSRINVKIKSGEETELNGQGPEIPEDKLEELFCRLDKLVDGDTIVLAGSIPSTMPSDVYERILLRLGNKKVRAVVDASKELLLNVLKYKPFLVKPNNIELGELFGIAIETAEDVVKYAKKLKDMGAVNVLVSMAGDGAVLIDEAGDTHICGVCSGTVVNSVGAGDSMLAGFIAGYDEGGCEYGLKLGTASGGATAFSEGLALKGDIFRLLEQLD